MYHSSEDAMEANEAVSLKAAGRELANHYCRILASEQGSRGLRIQVTNDCDPAEWIDCTTRSILQWLGY